ncbi:MAG: NAD(P)H-hydrate dehydratase [Spirochaetales bacterium]|nr:MAG: NAD(P)H-hydrate dehydratase [Spirochaetales bacterium]
MVENRQVVRVEVKMKVATSAQMTRIDNASQEEYGIPGIILMEDAGLSAWESIVRNIEPGSSVIFVVGKGNNGGDALVMARHAALRSGFTPRLIYAAPPDSFSPSTAIHAASLAALGVASVRWDTDPATAREWILGGDWIIDGLAGTGLTGALRSPLKEIADLVNSTTGVTVSIDLPSGSGDEWTPGMPIVDADITLTIGLPKKCLYQPVARGHAGEIRIVPIAFPRVLTESDALSTTLLDESDIKRFLPQERLDSYKGSRGVVAIFAGSHGTTGAAVLVSNSTLRAGAGMVTLYTDDDVYLPLAGQLVSVMVRSFDGDLSCIDVDRVDTVVAGPGWGRSPDREDRLRGLVRGFHRGVLDADALTVLAGMQDTPHLGPDWVLTPHVGELARLLHTTNDHVSRDFFAAALEASRKYNCIVVAKSWVTVIARPDGETALYDGMNPRMGTAGTGDVLAGTIGALLCRCADGWSAARAGVLVHGKAGRIAGRRLGYFLSQDLPDEIGRILGSSASPAERETDRP